MNSTIQRFNTLSSLWVNALLILYIWIAISTYFDDKNISSNVHLISMNRKITNIEYAFRNIRQEYAFIKFNIDTDITSLFNWNTKQVFIYIVASYASSKNYPHNEIILWNYIIRNKKDAIIQIKNQKNIFAFNDIEGSFANKNVTLSMHYNIMPHVGFLTWGSGKPSEKLSF
ncbi:hypothetical protein PCANB_002052 [Pneumocystis canis]|nr:hypothetical protein PCK1_001883 [Pneumocystis canis]KAG5439478.1 hypothetical protein PCANB_002052 [Pneumocystis canis]